MAEREASLAFWTNKRERNLPLFCHTCTITSWENRISVGCQPRSISPYFPEHCIRSIWHLCVIMRVALIGPMPLSAACRACAHGAVGFWVDYAKASRLKLVSSTPERWPLSLWMSHAGLSGTSAGRGWERENAIIVSAMAVDQEEGAHRRIVYDKWHTHKPLITNKHYYPLINRR